MKLTIACEIVGKQVPPNTVRWVAGVPRKGEVINAGPVRYQVEQVEHLTNYDAETPPRVRVRASLMAG